MVHFHTKNPNGGKFCEGLGMENVGVFNGHLENLCPFCKFYGHLVYFVDILYILWTFGIFCGHFVYFMVILYILWTFCIFCGHFVHFEDIYIYFEDIYIYFEDIYIYFEDIYIYCEDIDIYFVDNLYILFVFPSWYFVPRQIWQPCRITGESSLSMLRRFVTAEIELIGRRKRS
jgi:hypothetical protein